MKKIIAAFALVALFALGAILWIGLTTPPAAPPPPPAKEPERPKTELEPFTSANPKDSPRVLQPSPTAEPMDAISDILANQSLDFDQSVDRLLAILPTLDAEQQSEAAHHIANLSDDDAARRWAARIRDQSLPSPAAAVLYNDLLNRPHDFLMPFLAGLADMPGHPQQLESSETLEILYGQPSQGMTWTAHIKARLAEESAAE
jgi:hypothetical protein